MTTLTTPGVYIKEIPGETFRIASSASAVPIFVQASTASPTFPPVRILNWLEFAAYFPGGEPPANDILALGVRAYFLNGGGPLYVVRDNELKTVVPTLDDATLIVSCGVATAAVAEAVALLCATGRTLFAILDCSNVELADVAAVEDERSAHPVNCFSAIYYPWLCAAWASADIPPSAPVAGAYCATDRTRGFWKAPANIALKGGLMVKFKASSDVQSAMNSGLALNVIRRNSGGDAIIWGARTFCETTDWRYIPVRRLFNMVEKDVARELEKLLFEPNGPATWERARSAIDAYLQALWKQGGLMGTRQDEAYSVQVGEGVTMTSADISEGIMRIKVSLAAVRPAEFIVLEFTQILTQ